LGSAGTKVVRWPQSVCRNRHEFLNGPAIFGSGYHCHFKVNVSERGYRIQSSSADCIGDSSGNRHASRRIGLWEYYHKFGQTVPKEYISSAEYCFCLMRESLD
jgi:hypothetical protein